METYCRVVLREATRSFDREYTYRIPEELLGRLSVGSWVCVPFGKGNRSSEAYVTACLRTPDSDFFIKPVQRLLAERPVLLPDQIQLAARMRSRYLCSYGDALRCMVPSAVSAIQEKRVRMAELTDPAEAARRLADGEISRLGQQRVIELLLETGQAPVSEIMSACQVSRSVLATLAKHEWLQFYSQETRREPEPDNPAEHQEPFEPNPDQAEAIRRVSGSLTACERDADSCAEYLLFGVTGSGKTEVYLQAARTAVDLGRGVLILVPEIGLTPQMIGRIRSRFGSAVAVLHSRLTPSERYVQWQRILRQEVLVVVGARSAIFAPLRDIGLVIIDEEQESTYKSETHPRYHARDIARLRAREHGAVLVLGSATPSVESYQRSQSGQSVLLTLHDRIGSAGMAQTAIVDMREELRAGNRGIFSRRLTAALNEAFDGGHQAMIFINRRGFAGFVLCRNCGSIIRCKTCSVSMTIHYGPNDRDSGAEQAPSQLVCHYCGRLTPLPKRCPSCQSSQIGRFGAGTQQVEATFNQTFAPRIALRMDQDTTVGRSAHARILEQFEQGGADVLIGTQMIAKGHDFPNVTVVGILAADLMLGLSDFRSSERAFQLITQAAGRAGRGRDSGSVIIQAYNIDDYAIRFAAAQDYPGFFRQEIAYRKLMRYPPFGSIGVLTVSALQEEEARAKAALLADACRSRLDEDDAFRPIQVMDAAKAPIYRIRSRYRRRVVIRGPNEQLLARFLLPVVDRVDCGKAALAIDFDPYSML